jgi:hypothetical protein
MWILCRYKGIYSVFASRFGLNLVKINTLILTESNWIYLVYMFSSSTEFSWRIFETLLVHILIIIYVCRCTPKSVRKGTSLRIGTISMMRGWNDQVAAPLIMAMDIIPRLTSVKALLLTRVQFSSFQTEISFLAGLVWRGCQRVSLSSICCLSWCIFKLSLE